MRNVLNSFHNIKYKIGNLEDSINEKGYADEFKEELYDINIAIEYINEMIKEEDVKLKRKGII